MSQGKPTNLALNDLFACGEEKVLVRLLVLSEISARADNPSWLPRELKLHFSFLD